MLIHIASRVGLLLQADLPLGDTAAGGFGTGSMLVWLAFVIVIIASLWKVFEKAGQPGWAALIPIYNIYVMLQVAGRPGWWLVLAFIPLVNLVLLVIPFDIAGKFGKSALFGVGLLFLGFIFYPILAWGDAQYQG